MPPMLDHIDRQFRQIGARARFAEPALSGRVAMDVRRDRRGEYFELRLPDSAATAVLNADRVRRHLLLLVSVDGEKSKFLCGHDERHWFVAAIPESEAGVVDVTRALHALVPEAVRGPMRRLRRRERMRRRNRAFVRQGEWFFVPIEGFKPEWWTVRHDEPLSRGWGKPHVMEFAFRRGGVPVLVSNEHPRGLTQDEFEALPETERRFGWRHMVRDPEVYARGRITHPDHASVVLTGWHRVFMNTEAAARSNGFVAFLD